MSESVCTVKKVPLDELEAMLAKEYGDKLQPRRFDKAKGPSVIDTSKLVGKPKKHDEPVKMKTKLEPAKLEPKHLTADRLRKLVADGKTDEEVMNMYNFSNRNYFIQVIRQLGCRGIFKRASKAVG